MYGNGASRQQFAISNHLGYSVSYTTLVGRGKKARERYQRMLDDRREAERQKQQATQTDAMDTTVDATSLTSERNTSLQVTESTRQALDQLEQPIGSSSARASAPQELPSVKDSARPVLKVRHPGTLELLSQSVREEARTKAQDAVIEWIYDNINLELAPHDQVLGKTVGEWISFWSLISYGFTLH